MVAETVDEMDRLGGAAPWHDPGLGMLTKIKAHDRVDARLARCMGNIVFKCPATGLNVQHWLADEPSVDDPQCTFETVVCQACGRLHFINRSSRKLVGEKAP